MMGQVTLYIEDEIEKKMALAAKSANLSKSKWVASLIKAKVATDWPNSIVGLAGTWQDFPSIDKIRENSGHDVNREVL